MLKGCLGRARSKWGRCYSYERKNIRAHTEIFDWNLSFFKVSLSHCFSKKKWKMFSCDRNRYFNRRIAKPLAFRIE
jgi:hypothetical protein